MNETHLFYTCSVPEAMFAWGKCRATIERHIFKTRKLVSRRTDNRGGRMITIDSLTALWGAPSRSPFDYAGEV